MQNCQYANSQHQMLKPAFQTGFWLFLCRLREKRDNILRNGKYVVPLQRNLI